MMQRLACLFVLMLTLATRQAAADSDPYADARQQFLVAWQSVATTPHPDSPTADSETLRGYALYSYLQAARLQKKLETLPAATTDTQAEG